MPDLHEGFLFLEDQKKNEKGNREWKSRWFVLDEGYLRYFPTEGSLEPLATVPCRGITAKSVGKSRVGKHAFRLDVTKQEDGRYKYVLAGDDEADSVVWLELLKEHGAYVNLPKIRLTARAETGDLATRFFSFGTSGAKAAGNATKGFLSFAGGKGGGKGFLSFGGKDTASGKDKAAAAASEATEEPMERRRSVEEQHREGDFIMPRASIAVLASDGEIDGDAPYTEVLRKMSRAGVVSRADSLTRQDSSAEALDRQISVRRSMLSARQSVDAIPEAASPTREAAPTVPTVVEEPTGEDAAVEALMQEALADADSDEGGDTDDEIDEVDPVDEPTVGGAAAEATGSPKLVKHSSGEDGVGAGLMRGLTSFGNSFKESFARLSGAEPPAEKEEPDMQYGANYAPPPAEPLPPPSEGAEAAPAEAPVEAAAAPTVDVSEPETLASRLSSVGAALSPTNIVKQASSVGEGAVNLVKRISQADPEPEEPEAVLETPPPQPEAAAAPATEVEAAEVASNEAVADEVPEPTEAEPQPRLSFVEQVGALVGLSGAAEAEPEPVAEEPPAPPKPTIEDNPAEAAVRAWIKAVLLSADDLKTMELLNDRTVSLRDALRSGIVLCAILNALKPKSVGKVKAPPSTGSFTRFARLEPLQTYLKACYKAGLTKRDCIEPEEWLDGDSLTPLYDHLSALGRLFPKAPKFVPPGGLRKAPTRGGASRSQLGGVVPFASAADIAKQKGAHGAVTRSAAAEGNSAFRAAGSNASAAKAVFEAEKTGTRSRGDGSLSRSSSVSSSATTTMQQRTGGVQTTVRSNTGATHSFAESETIAFSDFINETLGDDDDLSHLLPINIDAEDFQLFDVLRDGVLLCKLINCAIPDTIDMRAVNLGRLKPLSVYEVVENLNMAINAAGAIGCRVVNIGPDDILSGSPHLCLGLLWQIVKAAIMANLNLKASPELMALLGADMDDVDAMKALKALAPEKVLLKWLNYQVQRVAPGTKEVSNFGSALKDCAVYAHLLSAVAPAEQNHLVANLPKAVMIEKDPIAKAALIIDAAQQLGVTQFKVMPADIAKGNEKLNMGFTAAIFNTLPGLAASAEGGLFNPALAATHAEIKEGGRVVRLTETGCALFGNKMEPNTGTHWVTLKVVEATEPQVYMGLMPPNCDKNGVPGMASGTTGLEGTGAAFASGAAVGQAGVTYGKGDVIKIEYDSDKKVLKWYKNGTLVGYEASGDAAPAMTHFAVGRGAGDFEVRLEDSSFMSEAARGAGKLLEQLEEDESDSREERAFRMWINSLGLDTHVNDLIAEACDGLLILEVMDKINPGVVDWKKVDKKPKNVHVKTINCNYAVELGKSKAFGFSLVGIGGVDIAQKRTKLVLAIVWQMMRYHIIRFLTAMSGSSKALTEADVLKWANEKVAAQSGLLPVQKLSDATLASGVYILTLIKAVAPRAVDLQQVTPGMTAEEKKLNARLAVSCARRAGCMIFALWEDIVECKPKMLLVLFATLMQLDIKNKSEAEVGEKRKELRRLSVLAEGPESPGKSPH